MNLPYGAWFKCLKCGYEFEHRWTGGGLPEMIETAFAATDCKKCGCLYVKNISPSADQ